MTSSQIISSGLAASARDYAKLGELFRNGGALDGQQLVPGDWVIASTRLEGAHVAPGKVVVGGHAFAFGYGYQWWIPAGEKGDYSAIGVYNQFIYVNPAARCVIVKLSANPRYGVSELEADNKDEENMALIRAIADGLADQAE